MTSRAVAWLRLAPWLGVVAYAAVLARRVPSLVHDTATSDSVGTMLVAQRLPSAPPGSTVTLGNAAHYTTLWFDEATRGLAHHRAIWEAMPYVAALLGLLILVETVRRLAGRQAALVCLAIGIATPPLLLLPQFAQAFHGLTVLNGIVLGALLVWLARTPRPTAVHVLAGAEAIAVLTGLGLASDLLLLVTGILPFALALVVLAWHRRDRRGRELLVVGGAVVLVSVVAGGLTALAMHRGGYDTIGVSQGVATPGQFKSNASLLGQLVLDFGNGRLTLHDLGFLGPARLLLGVIALVGALVPLWVLERVVRGRGGAAAASPARDAPHEQGDDVPPAEERNEDAVRLFLSYWGFVALLLLIVFLFSRIPVDRSSMRYLVSGFMAVAATVPFLTLRGRTTAALVALAVTVNGVLGALVLQRATLDDFDVLQQHPDGLVAALEAHGLHHGYAGYWQANLITWDSDGAVQVASVQQRPECHAGAPGWFCPYRFFSVSDWYAPQPGPSFLIREIGGVYVPDPPPSSVRPTSVFSYDRFAIYVYDHDIGADAAQHTQGWNG